MTALDVSATLEAKSDQINAADLAQPITVRISRVHVGPPKEDQPVHLHLDGYPGRPWKPCKTMRRLLAKLWGTDAAPWVGRWVRLYCDPTVRWGGDEVGGIRVSGMSHIDGVQSLKLPIARGKYGLFKIEPLKPPQAAPDLGEVLDRAGVSVDQFDAWSAAKDRPVYADLTDDQRAKLVDWLTGPQGGRAIRVMRAGGTESPAAR